MVGPDSPEVILCGAAERAALIRLYELCFQKTDGAQVLPWRYDDNPHGAAISVAARLADRTLISAYGCFPRRILHRGRALERCTVGQTGDVMTHPEHRGKGVFSRLDGTAGERARERGWVARIGLPNRRSAPIFADKLGWKVVGRVRPWTFVLHPDPRARAERLRAGRFAALAVPWTYFRGVRARGRLRDRAFERLNTVAIPRFQPDVDAVVAEVAAGWDWMLERDHRFLNWRFLDAPSGRFRAHGAYDASGVLRGYAVVQLPERGQPVGFVADLVGVDEVAVAGAMEAALGHLHKAGAAVARAFAVAGSWWEKTLRGAGFRPPKADDDRPLIAWIIDPDHPLAQAALDPGRWYFTDADRDDELVS